jgi:hypothetical protein
VTEVVNEALNVQKKEKKDKKKKKKQDPQSQTLSPEP